MKVSVYFKSTPTMHFDNVKSFSINGNNEGILRIDQKDGKTHFINFSEVIACVEEPMETEETE